MKTSAATFDRLIAGGPDPEAALAALERFIEGGGRVPDNDQDDARALLAALLASGSFLPGILLADVSRWQELLRDPWLARAKPRELVMSEVAAATSGAVDLADLERRLRRLRRREMLRLGARELASADTIEVAGELSALADACLQCATAFCAAQSANAWGEPIGRDRPARFAVLAMGKLGGQELNFSSDIDLIYVYSTDEGSAGRFSLHEYFARLAQMLTRAIDEITADGFVFRVDLRLRPEGRTGAICNSLAAAERYYETFGRTWERQALLRARPAAGDLAIGEQLLATLEPFIFPRSASAGTVDEVRALRRLHRQGAEGHGEGFNVKLGSGGIRDVELVAQLLQLLYAGRRRELRERATLPALHKLALAGLLSDREARGLASAYRFWRRVEHRVQLEDGAQIHRLPFEGPALVRMARRLGFTSVDAFTETIAGHRTAVAAIADSLGEPPGGPPAVVVRLLDAAAPRERTVADLHASGFADAETAADTLDLARGRLPAAWLEEAMASPDPDRALGHFRDLAMYGSLGLVALLRDQPILLRMLAGLFGTSERLSRHLVAHPGMWGRLVEDLGAPAPAAEHWRSTLAARLDGLAPEAAFGEMRRFAAEEILRVGLHDVAGNLAAEDVSAQLGALAEACLEHALGLLAARLAERFGTPDARLTVLGFGSLGAREMRYGSDLDLVFLYSRPGVTTAGMDHQEWFARLAQRLVNALGAMMDEGRLYEVDTRLRPSGHQGMLVTSQEAFARYHADEAAPWERVALLRARPVAVWPAAGVAGDDFARRLAAMPYEDPPPAERLRAELLRMRERIEKERAGAATPAGLEDLHLRFSPGGLTDLEFTAAFLQLARAGEDPALRTPALLDTLARLAERGALDGAILEDYRFLRRTALRLRLLCDRPEPDRLLPSDYPALARSMGLSITDLRAELATRMARVRAVFLRVLG
jgi:glutamate-ammonia-ligase adenylyltransferase